jgi:hypothetical protein
MTPKDTVRLTGGGTVPAAGRKYRANDGENKSWKGVDKGHSHPGKDKESCE